MKKLTLALVACLAVGASAGTRHYTTENGMVTVRDGEMLETRVVEVVPVRVVPVSTTTILVAPSSQDNALNVRRYDMLDTADTSDDLNRSDYYEYLYETRSNGRTLETDMND